MAGYYQGLKSVRERGMFPDTRHYVDNVLSLKARFRCSARRASGTGSRVSRP